MALVNTNMYKNIYKLYKNNNKDIIFIKKPCQRLIPENNILKGFMAVCVGHSLHIWRRNSYKQKWYRSILKIPWRKQVSNEDGLKKIATNCKRNQTFLRKVSCSKSWKRFDSRQTWRIDRDSGSTRPSPVHLHHGIVRLIHFKKSVWNLAACRITVRYWWATMSNNLD